MPDDFPSAPSGLDPRGVYISKTLTADADPKLIRLPDLKDIKNLSLKDLKDTLKHYGVTEAWESYEANAASYLARVSSIPPGPLFDAELERILDVSSKRGALGMSRRAVQTWSTLEAIDGNVNQEMMWLNEDDDRTCEPCDQNGGEIHTYAEWVQIGLPGAQTCLGGDYCRCDLLVID